MVTEKQANARRVSKVHRRRAIVLLCAAAFALSLAWTHPLLAQQPGGWDKIIERMEKEGCAALDSGVKVCRADYAVNGKAVEAISFVPAGDGHFPGVLMVPGYERTARDFVPLGIRFAKQGLAGIAVSQPGFGKSKGPPDFVGPKTVEVLKVAYQTLKQQPYVDPDRMAIYGYSRGGMAASLLATELDDVKAAVFGAGIYDFQLFYNDTPLPGARRNMLDETGMTKQAIIERSSILRMDRLKCPVLILHGERDENVPVSQAKALRDRLTQLHKEFEIKLFPDAPHSIGAPAGDAAVDFFRRKLQEKSGLSQKN
jgi:dipeptidyl aminopeptidase/acylaminoacyl peptidase